MIETYTFSFLTFHITEKTIFFGALGIWTGITLINFVKSLRT